MSAASDPDPLQPALRRAQVELAKHLDEACEAQVDDVTHGSVDELLHLEEELLAAARAADETVRLRRRLGEREASPDQARETADTKSGGPTPDHSVGRVREFRDRQGHTWRVWEVQPGLGGPLTELHRYLGDYVKGWLAFSCLDDETRKRLPISPPTGWRSVTATWRS